MDCRYITFEGAKVRIRSITLKSVGVTGVTYVEMHKVMRWIHGSHANCLRSRVFPESDRYVTLWCRISVLEAVRPRDNTVLMIQQGTEHSGTDVFWVPPTSDTNPVTVDLLCPFPNPTQWQVTLTLHTPVVSIRTAVCNSNNHTTLSAQCILGFVWSLVNTQNFPSKMNYYIELRR